MKRIVSIGLCIALMMTAALATAKTKIVYWGLWGGYEQKAVQQVIDQYNASQDGVEVEYVRVPDFGTKLNAAFASGDVPDCAFIWSTLIADYAFRGSLLPLDSHMKGSVAKDKFIPVLMDLATVKGKIYAWPTFPWTYGLYYNNKIMKDAGLDPSKPPRTIAELDALSEKLTVKSGDGRLDRVGTMPFAIWERWQWIYLFGGSLFDVKAGKITIDTPKNVETVKWLASYSKKWGVSQLQSFQGGLGTFFSETYPFWTGKTVLDIQGNWMGKYIQNSAPTLDWSFAPPPVQAPVAYGSLYTYADYNLVPKASRHPKEAIEFLKYWYSPDVCKYLTYEFYTFSPIAAQNNDAEYVKNHPNKMTAENARLAARSTAFHHPSIPVWALLSSELDAAIDKVVYQKQDAESALAEAQKKVEAEYKKVTARYK